MVQVVRNWLSVLLLLAFKGGFAFNGFSHHLRKLRGKLRLILRSKHQIGVALTQSERLVTGQLPLQPLLHTELHDAVHVLHAREGDPIGIDRHVGIDPHRVERVGGVFAVVAEESLRTAAAKGEYKVEEVVDALVQNATTQSSICRQ